MAALFLRPDADQSDGSWLNEASGNTNLFASVDESSFSDSDYIQSSTTVGDKVRLGLSNPGVTVTAPLTIRYRANKSGNAAAGVIGRLFEGTTQRATWLQTLDGTLTTYTYTLTSPEFSSITDFNNLFVEFENADIWWLANAAIDLSFATSRYYDASAGGAGQAVTSYLSCTRASTGAAKNSSGAWVSFASNVLRITDLGLLVEDPATNNLLNSDTPATQTTASLGTGSYTLWVEGSGSALASGGSATITGAASATNGNPNTFTVTVAGTVTVTVTGSLARFQLEAGTYPSSYITTTGAAATRAQDIVTAIGSLNTILNAQPMSMVVDALKASPMRDGDRIWWESAGTRYAINSNLGGGTPWAITWDGLQTAGITAAAFLAGIKVGVAQDTTNGSVVVNGGTVATGTDPGVISSMTLLAQTATIAGFNGYCRRLTAWSSKLVDATLQGFTV